MSNLINLIGTTSSLKGFIALLVAGSITLLSGPSAIANTSDPEVVKSVDLEKYMGTWYQIGRNPNFFQGLCERSMAEYSLNEDGSVNVLNTCYRNEKVLTTISGKATVPNSEEPAKLVVDFGFFRKGDYWIINLDSEYRWAVVSGPKKDALFILARTAPMDKQTLTYIIDDLAARGFDTTKIIYDIYPANK